MQFPWCRGDGYIHLSETETIEPTEIAYFIIREALQRAIKLVRENRKIDLTNENISFLPLNIGCGARFDLEQRQILLKISNNLGFKNIHIENIRSFALRSNDKSQLPTIAFLLIIFKE